MKTRNDTAIFTISPPSSQPGDFVPEFKIRGSIQVTVSTNGNAILCSMTRMYVRVLAIRQPDQFWTIRDIDHPTFMYYSSTSPSLDDETSTIRFFEWHPSLQNQFVVRPINRSRDSRPLEDLTWWRYHRLRLQACWWYNQPVVTFMYDSVSLLNNRDRMWEWQKGSRYPFRETLP